MWQNLKKITQYCSNIITVHFSTVSWCYIVLWLTLIGLIRYKLVLLYSYNEDKINLINNKNDNRKTFIIVFVIYLKMVSWKRILKLICSGNLILETQGKVCLLVTFIQRFVTQSKLSLISTETLLFPHKSASFLNDQLDSYKNADGNSKFYITKLIHFSRLTFQNN